MIRILLGIPLFGYFVLACIVCGLYAVDLIEIKRPDPTLSPPVWSLFAVTVHAVIFGLPGLLLIFFGWRARKRAAHRTAPVLVTGRDSERRRPVANVERSRATPPPLKPGMNIKERERALASLRPVLANKSAQAVREALEKNDYGSALDLALGTLVKLVGENPADSLGQRLGDLLCELSHTELFWSSFLDASGSIKDFTEYLSGLYPEDSREGEMIRLTNDNLQDAAKQGKLPDAVQLFGKLLVLLWRYRTRGDEQLSNSNCQVFFARWKNIFGRENRVLFLIRAALLDYAEITQPPRG